MPEITLAANGVESQAQTTKIGDDPHKLTIAVGAGESVTLTVTSADPQALISEIVWELDGDQGNPEPVAPPEVSVSRTVKVNSDAVGVYRAMVTIEGQQTPIRSTQSVALALLEPPPAGETPPASDGVVETDVGVYDPVFATTAGKYVGGIALAFCVAVFIAVFALYPDRGGGRREGRQFIPALLQIRVDRPAELADRVGWILPVGLAVGVLVLAAGALAGMLEVRGRLIESSTGPEGDKRHRGPLTDALTAGAKFLDSAKSLRATVLLVVAGTVIVCVAMLAVVWAPSSLDEAPDPAASTTGEPSATGSAEPTSDGESSSAAPADTGPGDAPTSG